MAIKVVPASEADAPRIVVIEKVAFGPNPISGALYPGPFPDGNRHLETKNINELRASPHCRWMKAVDEDLEAQGKESTIATAVWYFWDIPLTHEMLPPDGQYGPGANEECCELFFGGMKRNMLKWFEGKKVAHLKLLQTHPDHQKRGAGALLLKAGLAEADRLGIPAYLEASDEGKGLYEKFGFKSEGALTFDMTQYGGPREALSHLMVRPVQSK